MSVLERYLRHLTIERGLSRNTVSAYSSDLEKYLEFLVSASQTELSVPSELVAEYLAIQHRSGVRQTTLARNLAAIRGLHRFLVLEGLRTDDPAAKIRSPKPPRLLPKALTHNEVIRLLDAAGPEFPGDSVEPIRVRDRAILELLYSTGARVSELASLDLDEVTDSGLMRVRGKGSKERIVAVGSHAQIALDTYLARVRPGLATKSTPALFLNQRGGRLSRQSIWQIISSAGDACGLEVSPHTLRHCFATHLIEGGADVRVVQELLGHASVATTQIYTKVTIDTLREVYQSAHPRARR